MEHRISRRRLLQVAGIAAAAEGGLHPAWSQSRGADAWPSRPLRIVVGFPGGSSPDMVARMFVEPLSRAIGQPVIVENRTGASGNIAADVVAKSTDQHTIGMLINGNMTIAKVLNPATPYDPQRDLAPVSLVCVAPLVLSAAANAPGTDGRGFLAAARAAGNRWNYGTPGVGTVGHLGMEVLKSRTDIAALAVPYAGNPQVINAIISGELQMALLPPGLADVQIKAGKLRAIGVTSLQRSPLVPDIPTLGEVGVPNFQIEIWTSAAAPASMPPAIVAKLSSLIATIARSPEVGDKLFQHGYAPVGSTSEQLGTRLKADTELLAGIIASRGIRVE